MSTGAKKPRGWVALYATTRQPTGCRGYLEAMATTSERIYWEDPAAPAIQRLFPSIQIFLLHMASAPSFEHSNLPNNFFASSCDSRRPIISFATFHLRSGLVASPVRGAGDIIAMMFVTVMSVLLNMTGIELETRYEADLERELKAVGSANLLSASLGGYVTCSSLSRTTL